MAGLLPGGEKSSVVGYPFVKAGVRNGGAIALRVNFTQQVQRRPVPQVGTPTIQRRSWVVS